MKNLDSKKIRPGRKRIPRSRALCGDVLYFAKKIPTCAHDKLIDLSSLQEIRKSLPQRISWSMLFIKAYSIVASRRPELQQSYIRWPIPHIYQHDQNVAMVAVHREFDDEPWLLWGRFLNPESTPLVHMQENLERFQTGPFRETFTQQWQLSLFPTFLRRLFWFCNLNFAGKKRAKRLGTFGLSTLASKGVEIQEPPAHLTSCLTYGPFDEQGRSRVTIAYDHRLMDGTAIADALNDLEETLQGVIADELRELISLNQKNAA